MSGLLLQQQVNIHFLFLIKSINRVQTRFFRFFCSFFVHQSELIKPPVGIVPAMYGHSMFLYNNHLHVLGRRGYYKYNIQTRTWTKVPGTMPDEITTRYHSAVQDEGVVYLVGGRGYGQINGVRI